jgi:hypothetical protein
MFLLFYMTVSLHAISLVPCQIHSSGSLICKSDSVLQVNFYRQLKSNRIIVRKQYYSSFSNKKNKNSLIAHNIFVFNKKWLIILIYIKCVSNLEFFILFMVISTYFLLNNVKHDYFSLYFIFMFISKRIKFNRNS